MSERDTHFQGFAKLVVNELERNGLIPVHPKSLPVFKEDMAKIIAQRAYDLLVHDRMHTGTSDLQSAGSRLEAEEYVNGAPDLNEWPVEPDQAT